MEEQKANESKAATTKIPQNLLALTKELNHQFKNKPGKLIEALTRESAINENHPSAATHSYQLLEFLGDRILNLVIAKILYDRIVNSFIEKRAQLDGPNLLTQIFIPLVSNKLNNAALLSVAKNLQLEKFIIRGSGENTVTDKMYADAMEAIIGAIYEDTRQLNKVASIIKKLWEPFIDQNIKLILQEYTNTQKTASTMNSRNKNKLSVKSSSPGVATPWEDDYSKQIYHFRRKILSWDISSLSRPKYKSHSAEKLLKAYHSNDHCFDNEEIMLDDYYTRFTPLIVEEARAQLYQDLEKIKQGKAKAFKLTVKTNGIKAAKNTANPTVVKMRGLLPADHEQGTSGLVLALSTKDSLNDVLGLANININKALENRRSNNKNSHQVTRPSSLLNFDVKIKSSDQFLFAEQQEWTAYLLGSVVSYERMFATCKAKPQPPFFKALLSGQLNSTSSHLNSNIMDPALINLNEPQKKAVHAFLTAESGLHCLLGPPGTGKTTTIVALLGNLCHTNKRVLVCAPSNKAVQVLAERFIEKYPMGKKKAILAGVEQKLTPCLRPIFVHGVVENKLNSILSAVSKLQRSYNHYLDKIAANTGNMKPGNGSSATKQSKPKQANSVSFWDYFSSSLTTETMNAAQDLNKLVKLFSKISAHNVRIRTNINSLTYFQNTRTYCQQVKKTITDILSFTRGQKDISVPWLNQKTTDNKLRQLMDALGIYLLRLKDSLANGKLTHIDREVELFLLNRATVVFCTLCVSGRTNMHSIASQFDFLIIDEAAQAVEAETLIPMMFKPTKCLLVGDTKQLPAVVISKLAKERNYGWSMMWRLLEKCKQSCHMLKIQHRMHPEIRKFSSEKYYQGNLVDSESIKQLAQQNALPQDKILGPLAFIDINGDEISKGHSFANPVEANYVIKILNFLVQKKQVEVRDSVGIITFYTGQVELLSKKLAYKPHLNGVKVHTVDGFQGDENKIIIISCVRAKGKIGFLHDFRRLNVAITRARQSLIILGHKNTLTRTKSDIRQLIVNMMERKLLFSQKHLDSALKGKGHNSLNYTKTIQSKVSPITNLLEKLLPNKNKAIICHNRQLIKKALTRQSAVEEKLAEAADYSYQNLKWLGSRVLNFCIASILIRQYPNANEGQLHEVYSKLVSNKGALSSIGKKLALEKVIIHGEGEHTITPKMYADTVEALLGAIYLDNQHERNVIGIVTFHWKTFIAAERISNIQISTKSSSPSYRKKTNNSQSKAALSMQQGLFSPTREHLTSVNSPTQEITKKNSPLASLQPHYS